MHTYWEKFEEKHVTLDEVWEFVKKRLLESGKLDLPQKLLEKKNENDWSSEKDRL